MVTMLPIRCCTPATDLDPNQDRLTALGAAVVQAPAEVENPVVEAIDLAAVGEGVIVDGMVKEKRMLL